MNKELQEKLRLYKISLLYILHTLAVSEFFALELDKISESTHTAEEDLKGGISALRRIKIGQEFLIMPAGRDEQGRIRWKINENLVSKKDLAKFLEEEILGKEGLTIQK